MCVDHQRRRRDEEHDPQPAAAHEALDVRPGDHEREERLELVHARLLRVVGEERVERREQRAGEPGHAAEDRAPGEERGRDAGEPEAKRKGVRRGLAVSEQPHPDPEQHVVGGRRAVLTEEVRNRAPVLVRDPHRDALVDPETGVELARTEEQREERDQGERDGLG